MNELWSTRVFFFLSLSQQPCLNDVTECWQENTAGLSSWDWASLASCFANRHLHGASSIVAINQVSFNQFSFKKDITSLAVLQSVFHLYDVEKLLMPKQMTIL